MPATTDAPKLLQLLTFVNHLGKWRRWRQAVTGRCAASRALPQSDDHDASFDVDHDAARAEPSDRTSCVAPVSAPLAAWWWHRRLAPSSWRALPQNQLGREPWLPHPRAHPASWRECRLALQPPSHTPAKRLAEKI